MSTRRWHRINSTGVGPVWIFGSANLTGIAGKIAVFSDGSVLIAAGSDLITAAYGVGGMQRATNDSTIASGENALAMLIDAQGKVDANTLGAFSLTNSIPPTFPGTSAAPSLSLALIGGAKRLFVAGFFSYYFKNGANSSAASTALIDLANGSLAGGFTGQALSIAHPSVRSVALPLGFSDGGSSFGIYSTLIDQPVFYFCQFLTAMPSGVAALVGMYQDFTTSLGITSPVSKYGTTGFNGPFLISASGAFGMAFTSGRMALSAPVYNGSTWYQDSIVLAQGSNAGTIPPPITPSSVGYQTAQSFLSLTGGLFELDFLFQTYVGVYLGFSFLGGNRYLQSLGSYSFSTTFTLCGGWFADSVQITIGQNYTAVSQGSAPLQTLLTVVGSASNIGSTAFATAIASLYPGITAGSSSFTGLSAGDVLAYFDSTSAPASIVESAIISMGFNVTFPAWAGATIPIPGWNQITDINGFLSADKNNFVCHSSDSGTVNEYLTMGADQSSLVPSGMASNGALVCGAYYAEGRTLINVLGVEKLCAFGVSVVAVVPFKTGFAIALDSTSAGYWVLPKAAAGTPTQMFSPILVVDSSGAIDTTTTSAIYANFFSLSRSDGARFSPPSIAAKGTHLVFTSQYVPTYINPALAMAVPIAPYGDLTVPPTYAPFVAPGPGLSVYCECDSSGARVLPA